MNKILKHFITWAFGAICGGLFVYAIVNPLTSKMLAGETQMSSQIQDIYSQVTILHETPAEIQQPVAPEIPLLHGTVSLKLNLLGNAAPQIGPGKTWAIPMKVQPTFYGDASHAQIFFLDTKTHQLTGPYAPAINTN
jgi:hypothetical protein